MKKIIFFLFIISATNAQWEYETATIIDKGRKEIGIFSPFRVGLQNGMELSINKFIIMPTISIKQSRPPFNQWSMAQKLQLSYPSIGMKWLQSPLGKELGGIEEWYAGQRGSLLGEKQKLKYEKKLMDMKSERKIFGVF